MQEIQAAVTRKNVRKYTVDPMNRRHQRELARRKDLRRKIAGLIFAVIIMVVCLLLLSGFKTAAQPSAGTGRYTYYRTVCVRSGETLYSIARDTDDGSYANIDSYIRAISRLNDLHGFDLYAGQTLILPYTSDELK